MSAAFKATGVPVPTIGNNLGGFRQSGGGYLWKYASEVEGYPEPEVTVLQYTTDGLFVAEYKYIREAADKMGLSVAAIHDALLGRHRTSGGYIWKYSDNHQVPEEVRKKHENSSREYYLKNREAINAKHAEYRASHKAESEAYRKEYYKQNREKILARNRATYHRKMQDAAAKAPKTKKAAQTEGVAV